MNKWKPISQCGLTSSLSVSSLGLASSVSKIYEEANHNEVKYCDLRAVRPTFFSNKHVTKIRFGNQGKIWIN